MRKAKVAISPGFLLLAAWLNYMDDQGVLPGVFLSCVLHELGHLAVLSVLEIPVKGIRITAVGAEICVQGGVSYWGELLAVLAGPMVNFLLAGICCRIPGGAILAGVNLVLGGFNLLPVGSLDGGRALSCLLALTAGQERGEKWAQSLSYVFAVVLCAAGWYLLCLGGNPTLLLVSFWLLFAVVSHKDVKRDK